MSTNGYALLGLLMDKPMTGYMMKQVIDDYLSHFWKTSYGQIYPTMTKFIKSGYVTVADMPSSKGPASKIYSITEEGKVIFSKWLAIEVNDFNLRDETLLKFYFSHHMDIDEVIARFEHARDYNKKIRDHYDSSRDRMSSVDQPTRKELITFLSVKKGIHLNEARLKWAEEVIETLQYFKSKGMK